MSGVYILRPTTDACLEWVNLNVQIEDWQWFGGGIAVDQHYLEGLLDVMSEAGYYCDQDYIVYN